ncbi:hypothetical protein JOC27_002671, partial [Sporolactobacillus spathodeae]|nr:hypothetical protein [Sporolactobacillus spathodeae]
YPFKKYAWLLFSFQGTFRAAYLSISNFYILPHQHVGVNNIFHLAFQTNHIINQRPLVL